MDFCPNCGAMLFPKKDEDGNSSLECRCGYTKELSKDKEKEYSIKKEVKSAETVIDKGEDIDIRPKTNEECPKCGHNEAYWELRQTRSADEAETRFFQCVECGHKWRDYD